jgi:replicative DNA helicase
MTELLDQVHYDTVEQRVIGGLGVDPLQLNQIMQFLKPDMFSNKQYGNIFKLCLELNLNQVPLDELAVTHLARKNPALNIGAYEVSKAFTYASPMDVDMYSKAIAERWIKKQVKKVAEEASSKSSREGSDAFELLSDLIAQLEKINGGMEAGSSAEGMDTLIGKAVEYLRKGVEGIASGVPSGLTELDELTNGWQNSDLIIIAGRPAMGKSALVTTIIKNAAHSGFPCAIVSLEMSKYQVICRLVAEDIQLFVSDLTQRKLTPSQMEWFIEATEKLKDLPIFIDDSADMSIEQLRVKAREWKRKYNIQMLVVDYLQQMENPSSGTNREQEIGKISRGLKKIAKELDIPVIALSQLSRAVETRENKRPMMSDLRESGSIEQDADSIFFLYRPEYYAKIAGQECPPEFQGVCQLITGKFRNGECKDIILKFVGEYSTFRDRDDLHVNFR